MNETTDAEGLFNMREYAWRSQGKQYHPQSFSGFSICVSAPGDLKENNIILKAFRAFHRILNRKCLALKWTETADSGWED